MSPKEPKRESETKEETGVDKKKKPLSSTLSSMLDDMDAAEDRFCDAVAKHAEESVNDPELRKQRADEFDRMLRGEPT